MSKLRIQNTLTKKIQPFTPLKKSTVGMYVCGPTVYKDQHIGNYRTFIIADLWRRTLEFKGYKVNMIINITDVGDTFESNGQDKIELEAKRANKKARDIARHFETRFKKQLRKVHVLPPAKFPRASAHIKEQIELIKKLEAKGFTYSTSDGVYFDTKKFKQYGKLVPKNIAGQKAEARIAMGDKKQAADFALWKFTGDEDRQLEWNSPWGKGYPGWHIECSAMSMKYLGESFDIHMGGIDHVSIHHTNEIAQSEAATGKPFVKYWLHPNHLSMGEKMSKSKGNVITIDDIEKKSFDPLDFRYFVLQSHWTSPVQFSWEALKAARSARAKLLNYMMSAPKVDTRKTLRKDFEKALSENLHTPQLLSILWKAVDQHALGRDTLIWLDSVLGIGLSDIKPLRIPKTIQVLAEKRELARKEKDWQMADALRQKIAKKGWEILDTPSGPQLKKM